MSKMSDLAYEIEQMYIEGFNGKSIAVELNVPYEEVLKVLEGWSVRDVAETPHEEEVYSPFNG